MDVVEIHEMLRKFTVNGTFIPQDTADNDMCILFMKFGRCRFKTKCKKSHWVPPLPDDPYPVEIKPPLPNDDQICKDRENTIRNVKYSSNDTQKELLENISIKYQSPTSTSVKNKDFKSGSNVSKFRNNCMLPRRFKHVFCDNCNDLAAENSGMNRLFNEAGAYFDNVTKKLQIFQPPQNKIEKHHLKILRRIHWRNTQTLKEKLSQHPPSYNLKFDRSKINFTRLRPYVYVLVHECMCVDGEMKPMRPSSFEYLIADTLLPYLNSACITPQEAEEKLQQWGARAVRARHCIAHLWHILAISSNSPDGCAKDIIRIEEEVVKGSRTSLDYACACAFALKRVKQQQATMTENSQIPRKVSTSIKQGLDTERARKTKLNVSRNLCGSQNLDTKIGKGENAKSSKKHVTKISERRNEAIKRAEIVNDHAQRLVEHAETLTEHAETVIEHAGKLTGHAGKVTEDAEKVTEYAEDVKEHAEKATQHAQRKITHEQIPTIHEIVHGKVAQKQTEKLSNDLKYNSSHRTKRKRSRQFKNVPFNERKRFKTRCMNLLYTS